jgi:S-phase kinase-associated protein 1
MAKVRLICEGEKIDVDLDVVQKSTILKNMIEDTGKEGEIPIPNIQLPILKKVLSFCEHYRNSTPKEIKKPLISKELSENGVDEWDVKFIEMEKVDDLIDLIVAANFLDIESLVNLGCAKIATFIKGKSVEEIRDIFGIQNDFTPQEEAQLREENRWAEEAI